MKVVSIEIRYIANLTLKTINIWDWSIWFRKDTSFSRKGNTSLFIRM